MALDELTKTGERLHKQPLPKPLGAGRGVTARKAVFGFATEDLSIAMSEDIAGGACDDNALLTVFVSDIVVVPVRSFSKNCLCFSDAHCFSA